MCLRERSNKTASVIDISFIVLLPVTCIPLSLSLSAQPVALVKLLAGVSGEAAAAAAMKICCF